MQAINNADSLRKFRKQLTELADNLDRRLKETNQQVEDLSKTWRDEQFKVFVTKFEEHKKEIEPLSKKIKEFENPYLRVKEEKIRKFTGG